jgi:hypothetical protein
MDQVVSHPARGLARVGALVPAVGVDERRPGPGVADPVAVRVRRDRATEVPEVEQRGAGRVVGAVLVARDDDARDRVVERVLADVVGVVVGAVEALDDHLADARAHAEPDRRAHDEHVGREDPLQDLRPLVAVAEVGLDPEGDPMVDHPDDLGLAVEPVEDGGDPVEQGLGVGDLR